MTRNTLLATLFKSGHIFFNVVAVCTGLLVKCALMVGKEKKAHQNNVFEQGFDVISVTLKEQLGVNRLLPQIYLCLVSSVTCNKLLCIVI